MEGNRYAMTVFLVLLVTGAIIATTYAEDSKCLTCGEKAQKDDAATSLTSNIYLDILPGVCPKVINITSQGLLPVAVLGTSDFKVSSIDSNTTNLMREGSTAKIAPFRWHIEDVAAPYVRDKNELCNCQISAPDGNADLILEFDIYKMIKILDLQKDAGQIVFLNLTGNTQGGTIEGSDCIKLLNID